MDTFTADLDDITAGTSVTRYINDDDEFNYAVHQMEERGHDPEMAAEAMREWINRTPTWDCGACGLEGIEEGGWAYCPRCDAKNPSVSIVVITREGDGAHRAGHVWRLKVDGVYRGTFETKRQAHDAASTFTNGEG